MAIDRNDLIERLMADVFACLDDDVPVQVSTGVLREAAAKISRLEAEVDAGKQRAVSAETIIGNLQSLIGNVEGWVRSGCSETATKAMSDARKEGWADMGWRQHLDAYLRSAPPRTEGERA